MNKFQQRCRSASTGEPSGFHGRRLFRCHRQAGQHQASSRGMGVIPSVLSRAITVFEVRRGVKLLHRTSRSAALTAGEELRALFVTPMKCIEQVSRRTGRPGEDQCSGGCDPLLLDPLVPVLVNRGLELEVDVSADNRMIDVVGSGFNAGVCYGGMVPEDMIAQRLSPDLQGIAAASPAYLELSGTPDSPEELPKHRCIGISWRNDQLYQRKFERDVEKVAIATPGPVTVDAGHADLTRGLNHTGIIYKTQAILRPHLDNGTLKRVLDKSSSIENGF